MIARKTNTSRWNGRSIDNGHSSDEERDNNGDSLDKNSNSNNNSNNNNNDARNNLVLRRRHFKRKYGKYASLRQSLPHLLGILGVLSMVMLTWNAVRTLLQTRRQQTIWEQRQRAQQILQDRMQHMPHYSEKNGKRAPSDTKDIQPEAGSSDGVAQLPPHNNPDHPQQQQQQPLLWHVEFERARASGKLIDRTIVLRWLNQLDAEIRNNQAGGIRWIRPYLLPPLSGTHPPPTDSKQRLDTSTRNLFFKVKRSGQRFAWEKEWEEMQQKYANDPDKLKPAVDYTDKTKYVYPKIAPEPPPSNQYPILKPLKQLLEDWPQDEDKEGMIHETLMHFNYSDPAERAMAMTFRDKEVPFKFVDVPELDAATKKWTDEYVSRHFGVRNPPLLGNLLSGNGANNDHMPSASGLAQESPNNYFAFFSAPQWDVMSMGLPPVRNNDWDFAKFAEHAKYADAKRLPFDQPHFYWQSGVDREERYRPESQWTFISRDLPSFSSPKETFFVFHPELQKGIQCRFGERGVVAATHYDGGRNHVGMITGAKRYILSPPRECSKLGIFTHRRSPIYRHSLLNFAHIRFLNANDIDDTKMNGGMSDEERAWLERAGQADSLETVLKAGEVLYIPSHWFHYIVSLQKSAQCNVRAGIDEDGHPTFGNGETVEQCQEWTGPR